MSQKNQTWQYNSPEQLRSSDQVHVWRIILDVNAVEVDKLLGYLSVDELIRAHRFRFEKDKKRFITARGSLRCILGHYLQQAPHHILFAYTPTGKPFLADHANSDTLHFNLSHSGAIALCAVTRRCNIGVDIEYIRDTIAAIQIARIFFSPAEVSSLAGLQKTMLYPTFFRYWTRKEAILKAIGNGLSFPVDHIDVSAISENALTPFTLAINGNETMRWHVQDLFPIGGYAAAIAVEGTCFELTYLHYAL